MAIEFGRSRLMSKNASGWLPSYTKQLAPHMVVRYVTRNPHEDASGRVLPAGTFCLALRSPSGELCLLFRRSDSDAPGSGFTAVWGHRNHGLVGIEPNVVDPLAENLANVTEICELSTRHALGWVAAGCPPAPSSYEIAEEPEIDLSVDTLSSVMAEMRAQQMQEAIERDIGRLEREPSESEGRQLSNENDEKKDGG